MTAIVECIAAHSDAVTRAGVGRVAKSRVMPATVGGYAPVIRLDLFAGLPVTDYARSAEWYERFLGSEPSFLPTATEAVWELAEHRFIFIEERPQHAGHAMHTIFVDDLDALVGEIAGKGIRPDEHETYSNGVRKATYRDSDGNEIGLGGAPLPPGD